MIELPEAVVLSNQLSKELRGKTITGVIAAQNPHKFAWYSGDPNQYADKLTKKRVMGAVSFGGQVEVIVEDMTLVFSDGVILHYQKNAEPLPNKHQLFLSFDDETSLFASIAMYGGLLCAPTGKNDNQYYLIAKEKPSPLGDLFHPDYFQSLLDQKADNLSLKAFLATNQRIPGVGNGVLQDILFNAGFHPKKKVKTLGEADKHHLFDSIKTTLAAMTDQGGRDTEKDLYGNTGGYRTILSKNTVGKPCKNCGSIIIKEAYMGGSIYYCPTCQIL